MVAPGMVARGRQGLGNHERLNRVDRRESNSNRKCGLTVGFALIFIGGAKCAFSGVDVGGSLWLSAGATLVALAVLMPPLLRPLTKLWMGLASLLHRMASPVILRIIYWGVITPTGLLVRLLGRDPLRLRRDPTVPSYWIARDSSRTTTIDKQY
jgi:Saxitoxin biosynthesis operon protein SxtJ